MEQVHPDHYDREVTCDFGGETFRVRDNGAILRRHREGARRRSLDEKWTFGQANKKRGYMYLSSIVVHQVVATAFHGPKPSADHVVDHIDTNRRNNRPENLRWVTRLENILLNPITARRVELAYGSIENFLAHPDRPKSGILDPNFEWMRAVTKKDAAESHKRLLDWAKSEGMPTGGSLGEWLYSSRTQQTTEEASDLTVSSAIEGSSRVQGELPLDLSQTAAKVLDENMDRPPVRMPIISRRMAQHVDYCPIEIRNWEGKPYANFIDDCLYDCPHNIGVEDGYIQCTGGRTIESQDEFERWKARAEGGVDEVSAAITREIDPPETLIEHKAARVIIRHINGAALENFCATDNCYNYRGSKDEYWPPINYPSLIKIAVTGLAYDAGKDARDWDLSTMTGANYPDLERARTFLAKDERFRVGQHPETGELARLDVETALKSNFIEIAEKLVDLAETVKALSELAVQKEILTESELKEFLYSRRM